jgi:hypothetical protein
VAMMRHIKKFTNIQFKITECEDDILADEDSDDDEDEESKESDSNDDSSDDQ